MSDDRTKNYLYLPSHTEWAGRQKCTCLKYTPWRCACGCRDHTFFNLWFSRVVISTFRPFDPSDYWIGGWIGVVTGQNLVVSGNTVCDWNQASTSKFVATVQFKHQSWIIKLSTFFFCVWRRGQSAFETLQVVCTRTVENVQDHTIAT